MDLLIGVFLISWFSSYMFLGSIVANEESGKYALSFWSTVFAIGFTLIINHLLI